MKRTRSRRRLRNSALAHERAGNLDLAMADYDRELQQSPVGSYRFKWTTERRGLLTTAIAIDSDNRRKFGDDAPRFGERIWVHPRDVASHLWHDELYGFRNRYASAVVVSDWRWGTRLDPADQPKLKSCVRHWVDRIPWAETGIYDHMLQLIAREGRKDRCNNLADVVARYHQLDIIFHTMQQENRVRPRQELDNLHFREYLGIYMHIGPDGEPFFGYRGIHRFAMAQILGLPMPCQIGVVHEAALDRIPALRIPPAR